MHKHKNKDIKHMYKIKFEAENKWFIFKINTFTNQIKKENTKVHG